MDKLHPVTPPSELVEEWVQIHSTKYDLARQAAQWGADTELEACCAALDSFTTFGEASIGMIYNSALRNVRRPRPLTLKQKSVELLDRIQHSKECWDLDELNTIRQALDSLPND
jgi:hypothetical protein